MKTEEKRWGKIAVGNRCLYGVIIGSWEDPRNSNFIWILIKNDDPSLYEATTFSIYRYRPDVNGGQINLQHIIPPEILKSISEIDFSEYEGANNGSSGKEVKKEKTNKNPAKKKVEPAKKVKDPEPVIDDGDDEDDDEGEEDMFAILG
jgi:hypothetical protein